MPKRSERLHRYTVIHLDVCPGWSDGKGELLGYVHCVRPTQNYAEASRIAGDLWHRSADDEAAAASPLPYDVNTTNHDVVIVDGDGEVVMSCRVERGDLEAYYYVN